MFEFAEVCSICGRRELTLALLPQIEVSLCEDCMSDFELDPRKETNGNSLPDDLPF